MLITDALARFETQLEADGRSVHTRKQYRRHVLALAHWVAAEDLSGDVRHLGHDDLARFLSSPVANSRADGKRKKATSTNALRSSLRVFFRYAHEAALVASNPARLIRRAITSPPPPRALTAKEEARLLGCLRGARGAEEKRDAVLFRLLLRTGLRLSSAVGLDVEDVDLEEGVLAVHTKRDRRERIFMAKAVQKELGRFIGARTAGPLFTNQSGGRITSRHAQRRFGVWRERAGLPGAVSPHALRHTFATGLYRRTGDVALVQRALGHRSIASTLVYARASDEQMSRVLRA